LARGGRSKDRTAPERRCIATGAVRPKPELIRFVASPDGEIIADIAGKLPGRGIWVSARRPALEKAIGKRLFSRAAGMAVSIPDGLLADVEAALVQRLVQTLALARKAGQAVGGATKVKDWLVSERAALLIQAMDGSPRERARMRPPDGPDSLIEALSAEEIGLSFGREHVIHAALAAGGLAETFREDAMRLSGVRELDGGISAGKVKKTK